MHVHLSVYIYSSTWLRIISKIFPHQIHFEIKNMIKQIITFDMTTQGKQVLSTCTVLAVGAYFKFELLLQSLPYTLKWTNNVSC